MTASTSRANPNPLTLGKAAFYAAKFEKAVHESSDMLRKAVNEMTDELDAEVPIFVDKILRLAIEEQVPEIMNILKASPEEQRAYLDKARKSAGLSKAASNPLKKINRGLPSAEELMKAMRRESPGPPTYTHAFDPNTISKKKALEFSGIPYDDIMRGIKQETKESLRKGRERLMRKAEDAPDTANLQSPEAANFMVACIQERMNSNRETMDEAKSWCKNFLMEHLNLKPEMEGREDRERVLSADYDKMRKTMEECIKRKREADPNLTVEEAMMLCGEVEKGSKMKSAKKVFEDLMKQKHGEGF